MDTMITGKGYATGTNKDAGVKQRSKMDKAASVDTELTGSDKVSSDDSQNTNTAVDSNEDAVSLMLSTKTVYGDDEEEEDIGGLEKMLERLKDRLNMTSSTETQTSKKVLNYNYKKVSGSIMRAKTVAQAGNAITSANSNLLSLRKKASSGNYDDDEINIAITHAKKMVRAAKKKLAHLKFEVELRQDDDQTVNRQEKKVATVEGKDLRIEAKKELLELKKKLKALREQDEQADRSEESIDQMDADMEYLKSKIELMKQGKGDYAIMMANMSGVSNLNASMSSVASSSEALAVARTEIETSPNQTDVASAASVSQTGVSAGGFDVMI